MSRTALTLARNRTISLAPEILEQLEADVPIALGVSGGKDSCALAFATHEYLDGIQHTGPRLLIHADLGLTEWQDSLPTCERLAKALSLELAVVRRPQGDMMERWEQRWHDNTVRYRNLSCVKLILPWSTPEMRFCTAEMKVDQICRFLSRRWPGQTIINATGIRKEESTERSKSPIWKRQPKLESTTRRTIGLDWHPILDWTIEDVFGLLRERDFPLHEAYTVYGASRVSCVWCILAKEADHLAAVKDDRNVKLGRRMVDLEIASTFAFQGKRWLGDTISEILTPGQLAAVTETKNRAVRRMEAEARIPKYLLYTKGWPNCLPTSDEATLLAAVRFAVNDAVGLPQTFVNPREIVARYDELLTLKDEKAKR